MSLSPQGLASWSAKSWSGPPGLYRGLAARAGGGGGGGVGRRGGAGRRGVGGGVGGGGLAVVGGGGWGGVVVVAGVGFLGASRRARGVCVFLGRAKVPRGGGIPGGPPLAP